MGFIVPDVARTLDEEQKEEALEMGNPKAAFSHPVLAVRLQPKNVIQLISNGKTISISK